MVNDNLIVTIVMLFQTRKSLEAKKKVTVFPSAVSGKNLVEIPRCKKT